MAGLRLRTAHKAQRFPSAYPYPWWEKLTFTARMHMNWVNWQLLTSLFAF